MGVEYDLVCWKHHEEVSLGKLRETYEMVEYFLKHPRAKVPEWLPHKIELLPLLLDVRRFRNRHRGCGRNVRLINDHMDLEDADFIEVNFDGPLPTKEDFVKHCESKAVPLFRETLEHGKHIEYSVQNWKARDLGAKDRIVKITKHIGKIEREPTEMSSEVYLGEDGLYYEVYSSGGVGVINAVEVCTLCSKLGSGRTLKGGTTKPLWVCSECIRLYGEEDCKEMLDKL